MEMISEKVNCQSLGSLAHAQFADCCNGTLGQVIAVFQKAFYIRTKGNELLFVRHRGAKSPITLTVLEPVNFKNKMHAGSIPILSSEGLRVDKLEVVLRDYELYSSDVHHVPKNRIPNSFVGNVLLASRLICTLGDAKCVLGPESPAYDKVLNFSNFAAESDPNDKLGIMNGLVGLLGLGFGFTPSGDDYVAGFLAAHNAISQHDSSMMLDGSSIEGRTSWISGKLVSYAQSGLVDEELRNFLLSLAYGSELSVVSNTIGMASRGHTSGLDSCAGAVMGLAVAYDRANSSSLRRKVFSSTLGIGNK